MAGFQRLVTGTAIILLAQMTPLYAQTGATESGGRPAALVGAEVGMSWGRGPLNYADGLQPGTRDLVSVETCLYCNPHRAMFLEYSRWRQPRASYPTGYRAADTVTAGVRFQTRGRVRPFFDAGVAVGGSRYQYSDGRKTNVSVIGGVVGSGVTIPVQRFYVRVGGRLLVMSDGYVGGDLSVGAGWRF
jgi:hypothetical protein